MWPFTPPFSSLCRYWNPSEVGLRSIAVDSPLGVCGIVERTPTCTSIASRNWGETRTVEPRVGQACCLASLIRRARWQVYTDCVCLCELPCGRLWEKSILDIWVGKLTCKTCSEQRLRGKIGNHWKVGIVRALDDVASTADADITVSYLNHIPIWNLSIAVRKHYKTP